jgi:hypothetical protein
MGMSSLMAHSSPAKAREAVQPASAMRRRIATAEATRPGVPGPRWSFGTLPIRQGNTDTLLGHRSDRVATSVMPMADAVPPRVAGASGLAVQRADFPATEIPAAGVLDDDAVDLPEGGGATPAADPTGGGPVPGPGAGAATPAADSCGQPRSMGKTVSGAFIGGVTMDDYYPDLTGRGFWQHPGAGGTFDTGTRAGGVAQLFGVIPSPCEPSQYTLAQSVTRTRDRINGVTNPTEGQTLDDLAKSGRHFATAPFRQEFLGGGTAPLGYVISMADPPSIGYGPATNAEWDRDFVTSLIGPAGRQSVSWSLSVRIENGVVKRNTLS